MASPARDVAAHLAAAGIGALGGTAAWAIFVGSEPAKPDNCLTVYDTGGGPANADGLHEDPSFQIRARGRSYEAAYAKLAAAKALLLLPTSRVIGTSYYTGFWLISDITKIGRDADNRNLLVVNFRTMRQPA